MEYPEELRYSKEHEWVRVEGNAGVVGITDFAQDALGDVVYVQLPDVGVEVIANASIAEIESTKSVSEVYVPVTGTVVEVNDDARGRARAAELGPVRRGLDLRDRAVATRRRSTASWTRPRTAPSWRSRAVERWRLVDDLDVDARRGRADGRRSGLPRRGRGRRSRRSCGSTAGRRPRSRSAGSSPRPTSTSTRCAALGVEVVRRPTGGQALLHGGDLTYAVAMPRPSGRRGPRRRALPDDRGRADRRAGRARGRAPRSVATGARRARCASSPPRAPTCGWGSASSAARPRSSGATVVLQHGSILLDRLPFDELDLLARPDGPRDRRTSGRGSGRRAVTLEELGVDDGSGSGGGRDRRRVRVGPRRHVRVEGRAEALTGDPWTAREEASLDLPYRL